MNIEILRNTLYKAYLDDFAAFCNKLGGATAEVMGDLLAFEVHSCLTTVCQSTLHLFLDHTTSLASLCGTCVICLEPRHPHCFIPVCNACDALQS